jgi:hypothetical protein
MRHSILIYDNYDLREYLKLRFVFLLLIPFAIAGCFASEDEPSPVKTYFDSTQAITMAFSESRDAFNKVAIRSAIDETPEGYRDLLRAAASRQRILAESLKQLEAMQVDTRMSHYHDLYIQLHERSIEFLGETQVAFDINQPVQVTDQAFDKKNRIFDTVEFLKDEMQLWLTVNFGTTR